MEITQELDLNHEQKNLLVMLKNRYGESPQYKDLYYRILDAAEILKDQEEAGRLMKDIEDFITWVLRELRVWKVNILSAGEDGELFSESLENFESIFDILRIRARELVARSDRPDAWEEFSIPELSHNYMNVFRAIEKNSKGRYRIVYNLAEHDKGSYLVNFGITSRNQHTVRMPAVFQDIMRDLLANARKYTETGGRIEAGFYDSGNEIRFVITDSGRGIDPTELRDVILFGKRGSNVQDRDTRGGGFGLTKAYYYTRHFGGRFWIDSQVGKGTTLEIRIPRPA